MLQRNPKMDGSGWTDCVPQRGPCPNQCPECFYNRHFYAGFEPVVPTLEEAKGKKVRVNSGNDSNVDRELVIATTAKYPEKCYNTSLPYFDFPGPVVFTCNGPNTDAAFLAVPDVSNLMGVRVRVNTWNLCLVHDAVSYYTSRNVPVILTFMHYYDEANVRDKAAYSHRKYILHPYWCITESVRAAIVCGLISNPLVRSCGTITSNYCRDCGTCEWAYRRFFSTNHMPWYTPVIIAEAG